MKECSKCKIIRDESDYRKDERNKSGLRSCCKQCDLKNTKEYKKKNQQRVSVWKKNDRLKNAKWYSEYNKQYRKKNIEVLSENNKAWRRNNKDRIIKYLIENKDYISERAIEYRKTNHVLIKKIKKKYREKNRDAIYKTQRNYDISHKEERNEREKKYREFLHNRYIRKLAIQQGFTIGYIEQHTEILLVIKSLNQIKRYGKKN